VGCRRDSISYFNKVDILGLAWIVNATKSTYGKKAEIDGKTWMLAVALAARASMYSF
jgi:hypothetical protein